jgi:hypothetical protein
MKNIFVLPTDKPSRLGYLTKIGKELFITSDEKIKEGQWCLYLNWAPYLVGQSADNYTNPKVKQKIILTTDQDLINDGVQAIDDEFLGWFVKNPSCESIGFVVENYKEDEWVDDDFGGEIYTFEYERYKIIIPKEETKPVWKQIIEDCGGEEAFMEAAGLKPKQDRTCSNNCSVVCGECQILEHKQEPCDNCNNDVCCCTIKKQETIEDGANKWVFETNADRWSNNDDTAGDNYGSFIAGAKSDVAKNYWYAKFKDENGLKNIK